MIINRVNQYLSEVDASSGLTPYGKKGPEKSYITPPIIQHKDNISELTIFNTGWSEGYREGYADGENEGYHRVVYASCIVIGLAIGLALGAILL